MGQFRIQPEAIDLLCDYLHNTFRHRDQLYALAERNRHLRGRAHVNDMRMLFELPKSNGDILDQKDFPWKGFDHSIRESEEGLYTMDGGIKLLTRGDHGMWVAHRNSDGVEVPFLLSAFSGLVKIPHGPVCMETPGRQPEYLRRSAKCSMSLHVW